MKKTTPKCNQFVIAALLSHAKEIQSQNFGAVNKDYVICAAEVRTTSAMHVLTG